MDQSTFKGTLQWLRRIEFKSSELCCENQLREISVRRYSNSANRTVS